VSDELLEDAPQISAYLNQRLQLFVSTAEEAQVLLGNGSAPNLAGIVSPGNRTIGTYARGTADDNATAIFKAANGTRGSSFLDPDTVVIHPTNWQAIRLGKDSSGQYYGGGPFYGPYGGPQGPASASQFQTTENLWNMRVVVGSCLVGAFGQGAAIHRRGGLRVEASNSHSTFFASNLTAIRAEERLALCLYRPTAFTVVTGLA
jgi:HK97 family phage major capsid protein